MIKLYIDFVIDMICIKIIKNGCYEIMIARLRERIKKVTILFIENGHPMY